MNLAWWLMPIISAFRELRQEGYCELKASLGYRENFRSAWARVKPYLQMLIPLFHHLLCRRENPCDAVVFHPKFIGKTLETLPEKR